MQLQERLEINTLDLDVRALLRKKKYDYAASNQKNYKEKIFTVGKRNSCSENSSAFEIIPSICSSALPSTNTAYSNDAVAKFLEFDPSPYPEKVFTKCFRIILYVVTFVS